METDLVSLSRRIFIVQLLFTALKGSKTPTSKFSESEEVRWGISPVKSGSTNNQWGMNKTPLIKVSLYFV